MRTTTARRAATAALLLGVGAGLAGCSTPVPQPQPQAQADSLPALEDAQVDRVLTGLEETVEAGDAAQDAAALAPRLQGAALSLRQAGYTVRTAVPTAPEPAPVGGEALLEAVPPAGEWPRWFLAVTRASETDVPQVSVLAQASARDPYRLSASATLLPGTTLPELDTEEELAVPVAADSAEGLVMTPADAVARYADVLTTGSASQWAGTTADDIFRQQVLAEADAERTAVGAYYGYASTHAPRAGEVWGLRTADGGALVVGVVDGARTFTPNAAGIRQVLPPEVAALAGRPDAAGSTVRTAEVLVLAVPPEGSTEPLRLLAGNRGVVAVEVR